MKERFKQLLTVKSIVTLEMATIFCYLSIKGTITASEFLSIFNTVLAFYFGVQHEKNKGDARKK